MMEGSVWWCATRRERKRSARENSTPSRENSRGPRDDVTVFLSAVDA